LALNFSLVKDNISLTDTLLQQKARLEGYLHELCDIVSYIIDTIRTRHNKRIIKPGAVNISAFKESNTDNLILIKFGFSVVDTFSLEQLSLIPSKYLTARQGNITYLKGKFKIWKADERRTQLNWNTSEKRPEGFEPGNCAETYPWTISKSQKHKLLFSHTIGLSKRESKFICPTCREEQTWMERELNKLVQELQKLSELENS